MRPIKTTIRGIGPHADTEINWVELQSPIAVCAPYGTGKTFCVEAVLAALYGRFAWYPGSLYDAMTQGGTGEAEISLWFEHGDQHYLATRTLKTTGKTKSQKAVLLGEDDRMLAGPKVGDFDRAIGAMLGDADTALATWFLSQNRYGDLCGQPGEPDLTARRRGVLNNLIGASHLDTEAERIAEVQRNYKAERDVLQHQIGTQDYAALIRTAEEDLATCRVSLEQSRTNLQDHQATLDALQVEIQGLDGAAATAERTLDAERQAAATLEDLQARCKSVAVEISRLEARAAQVEYNTDRVRALEECRRLRVTYQERQVAFETWRTWKQDEFCARDAVVSLARVITALEAVPGVDVKAVDLAARLDDLRLRYRNGLEANKRIEGVNRQRDELRGQLSMNIRSADDSAHQARARLDKKPETPGGDVCNTCPLLTEYVALPDLIARYERESENYRVKLAEIPPNEEPTDLSELITQGEAARNAAESVKAAQDTRAKLDDAKRKHANAEQTLAEVESRRPAQVDDPGADLVRLQNGIDLLADAPAALKAAQEAEREAEAKQAELVSLQQKVNDAQLTWERCKESADQARHDLAFLDSRRVALTESRARAVLDRQTAQDGMEQAISGIARAEADIASWKREEAAQREKAARIGILSADLDTLDQLRLCFGPRGVRQILIDNAAPELEAIADDLFERATAGRQRLRIATQRVLADGSVAEAFDILIRDSRGERDALRYSGGQLQLILILFRLAVALWVGKLHGVQPDCLFLDEAFDRLGDEGAEDLLRVLDHLGERIGMIVVVTHSPEIAARLCSQVRLTRSMAGVAVETSRAA